MGYSQILFPSEIPIVGKIMGTKVPSVSTNSMDIVIRCSVLVVSRPQQFPLFDRFQNIVALHPNIAVDMLWAPQLQPNPGVLTQFLPSLVACIHLYSHFSQVNSPDQSLPVKGVQNSIANVVQ